MEENSYESLYHDALGALQEARQGCGSYKEKEFIEPNESNLDSKLDNLECFLRKESLVKKDSKTHAMRLVSIIRDGLVWNYWSDIKLEAWDLMIEGMEKLKNPEEKIIRYEVKCFYQELIEKGVHPLPNTVKAEKIGN